ncbi:MAG: type VI secretion system tip protein VgrG [Myxococcales bacterium]|nr:type VI secretion system tip protein VgrG [Myxococcales bacterium]
MDDDDELPPPDDTEDPSPPPEGTPDAPGEGEADAPEGESGPSVGEVANKIKKQAEAVGTGLEAAGKIIDGLTSGDGVTAGVYMGKATAALGTHVGGVAGGETLGKIGELAGKASNAAASGVKAIQKAKKAAKKGGERAREREEAEERRQSAAAEERLEAALVEAEHALGMEPKRVSLGFEVGDEADLPRLLVSSFTLDEAMDTPYRAEISLIAARRRDDDPQFERLVGRSVALVIERDVLCRKVHGIIERVSFGRASEREWYVDVVVVPALALLGYGKNRRIFQSQSIPDVLQTVLGMRLATLGREVRMDVDQDAYPIHETITQFDESDLAFCQQLMCEAGIGYWFAASTELDAEELVLSDRNEAFARVPTLGAAGVLPYEQRRTADVRLAEPMYVLEERRSLSTTVVSIGDVQWTDRAVSASEPHPLARGLQLGMAFALIDDDSVPAQGDAAMETYAFAERGPFTPDGEVYEQRQEALDLYTQAATLSRYGFRAESVAIGCAPGHVFELTGHPREELNYDYLILGVRHTGRRGASRAFEGTVLGGAETDEYENELRCVRTEHVYRPPTHELARLRPSPPPVQSATVIGSSPDDAEEVVTDAHGRVRVAFAWDRGEVGAGTTAWLRVAQPWAGEGYGAWFLPRVGNSVLVSFLDGDVDRPVIVGSVHDGPNPAPWGPSVLDNKTRFGIHTRSTPGDGSKYNELSFEDAEGKEEIFLHAQRNLRERVRAAHTTSVGASQTLTVGKHQVVTIDGSQNVTIKGEEESGGVTGASLDVTGDYAVETSNTIHAKAPKSITLECEDSKITLAPGKIVIATAGSKLEITADILAQAANGSILRMKDSAKLVSKDNSEVYLDANGLFRASHGSYVKLDDKARMESKGMASLTLSGDAELVGTEASMSGKTKAFVSGGVEATLGAGSSAVKTSPSGTEASGVQVNLSGTAMVNIAGPIVKIN